VDRKLFLFLILLLVASCTKTETSDSFAKCLADSGTKMYGAFWCPHCNEQKSEFGDSWLTFEENNGFVECSTPDGKSQTDACKAAGISAYPTWRFPDGTQITGKQSFETLAQRSGCKLS